MIDAFRTKKISKMWLVVLLLAIGGGIGFELTKLGLLPIPTVEWTVPVVDAGQYIPSSSARDGSEVVLIYIGASTCGWSAVPELPDLINRLKLALLEQARAEGKNFSAMGIARDAIAVDGWRHLQKFGRFDEIATGHSWANVGIQRYLFGEIAGPAATPQVLVVERNISSEYGHISVEDERLLLRKVGVDQISKWTAAGAPLPGAKNQYQIPQERQ